MNNPGSTATATCGGDECTKVGTKYLATVQAAGEGAPEGTGATHKLETGTVPLGLYSIKLWGINDVTPDGTASAASTAVATFGELWLVRNCTPLDLQLCAALCAALCAELCAAAVRGCGATSC